MLELLKSDATRRRRDMTPLALLASLSSRKFAAATRKTIHIYSVFQFCSAEVHSSGYALTCYVWASSQITVCFQSRIAKMVMFGH